MESGGAEIGGQIAKEPWYRKYRVAWFTAGLVFGAPACLVGTVLAFGGDCNPRRFDFVGFVSYPILVSLHGLLFGLAARFPRDKLIVSATCLPVIVFAIWCFAFAGICGTQNLGNQKRTLSDMNRVGLAVEAYTVDHGLCPQVSSMAQLRTLLEPAYIKHLPLHDSWRQELRYVASQRDKRSYVIVSFGKCGEPDVSDISEYLDRDATGLFGPTNGFQGDIVHGNGRFLRYPEGTQN
jgi:hypothetical protein